MQTIDQLEAFCEALSLKYQIKFDLSAMNSYKSRERWYLEDIPSQELQTKFNEVMEDGPEETTDMKIPRGFSNLRSYFINEFFPNFIEPKLLFMERA